MKRYRLAAILDLLTTRGAIHGLRGTRVLQLLVDTGASRTILPSELLVSLGYDPSASPERVRLVTGSGYLMVPLVKVQRFQALGKERTPMMVVAHTLPSGLGAEGVLGMDFLRFVDARIQVKRGFIEVPK